jgi:Abnormal spindle-like microcephaly-assoc'd, ASPM-SPD-2-Hydin
MLFAANPGRLGSEGTFSATPTRLAFGDVPVGTKNTRIIQLKNGTTANILISKIAATGRGFSVFGINTPTTLRAGSAVQFDVAFLPETSGTVDGTMTVTESSGSKLTVALSGTGEGSSRTLDVTPGSVSFGDVDVNETSTADVTLKNGGNSNISVTSVTSSGTGLSTTGVSANTTIEPRQSATIKAEYAPKAAGNLSGTITIASNASNGTSIKVPVTGTAVAPPPSGSPAVDLHWNASSSSGVTGYNVYRGTASGGPYTKLSSSPVSGTGYTDSTVTAGKEYFYVVTAVNADGSSGYSNQASVTVP